MSIISASTTSTTAYKVTADTTGTLVFQTGASPTTAMTLGSDQSVTFAGTPTYSGGTANGVAYLNGSKVLTTGTALVFDGSNLGVGVTPSAWSGGYLGLQVKDAAFASFTSGYTWVGNNWYNNAGNKYIGTGPATLYEQNAGKHSWLTAPSGTAGNPISFTQAMTLDASGNLSTVGTISNILGSQNALFGIYDVNTIQINSYSGTTAKAIRFAGYTTEYGRFDSSGNLLVGTTNTWFGRNVVSENSGGFVGIVGTITDYSFSAMSTATSGNNLFAGFWTDSRNSPSIRGTISYNRAGGLTAYNTTSDYRSKTVNGPVQNALARVVALKPSTGRMNGAEIDIDFFVAHELQEVVPSAVTGEKDAVNEDGTPNYQMVDKSALIPLLTAAIQEQQAIIETLTNRITALEAK